MSRSRKDLWFNLPPRMNFVDITPGVDACLPESGVCEGLCLVKTTNGNPPNSCGNLQEVASHHIVMKNPKGIPITGGWSMGALEIWPVV